MEKRSFQVLDIRVFVFFSRGGVGKEGFISCSKLGEQQGSFPKWCLHIMVLRGQKEMTSKEDKNTQLVRWENYVPVYLGTKWKMWPS